VTINQSIKFARAPVTGDHWRRTTVQGDWRGVLHELGRSYSRTCRRTWHFL